MEHGVFIKFLTKRRLPPKIIKKRVDNIYCEYSPSYSVTKEEATCEEVLENYAKSG